VSDPATDFDGPWKEALEGFFEPFLATLFPAAHAGIDWSREPVFLDTELAEVAPESAAGRGTVDKLVKVWTPDGVEAWVFVHVEVQSQRDPDFARRMYAYNHRLEDKHGRMPVSLAVLGDAGPGWRPAGYEAGRWGCEVRFAFPAVKLLDYRDREDELERSSNPFAAVVLAHLKAVETDADPAARGAWKFRLVKGLYDRGLDRAAVRRLFRLIDGMLTLPPVQARQYRADLERFAQENQVPFITQTEQLWLEDGRAQGRLQAYRDGVRVVLPVRFGQVGLALMPRVEKITDPDALQEFLNAIPDAPDLAALDALLPPA
jgi:hypothetical protein